jgi:hypothetical protein
MLPLFCPFPVALLHMKQTGTLGNWEGHWENEKREYDERENWQAQSKRKIERQRSNHHLFFLTLCPLRL